MKACFGIHLAFIAIVLVIFPLTARGLSATEHQIFTEVLKKHVKKGKVNYTRLSKSPRFKKYLQQLQNIDPNKIQGRNRKLAFWINVYNAFTLKLIIDNYPIRSISRLHRGRTVWKSWKFSIRSRQYTLDHVEHKIIRKIYKEPRIHAALVCAALSCPPLRSEAYEGEKLNSQLREQMRIWFSNPFWNYFDSKSRVFYLSKIFKWFKNDFGGSKTAILKFILPYLPEKTRLLLKKTGLTQIKIKYLKYNWNLNQT